MNGSHSIDVGVSIKMPLLSITWDNSLNQMASGNAISVALAGTSKGIVKLVVGTIIFPVVATSELILKANKGSPLN